MLSITIVTAQGVKEYIVGYPLNGGTIWRIKKDVFVIDGCPKEHYCGYDKDSGQMLFSINCDVPCVVEYKLKD